MAPISRVSPSAIRAATFILAHIGGGGDYAHTFPAVVDCPNIYPDLSGSGVDRGMLDAALAALGAAATAVGLRPHDVHRPREAPRARRDRPDAPTTSPNIRWRNAARIFPAGSFPALFAASPLPARRSRE